MIQEKNLLRQEEQQQISMSQTQVQIKRDFYDEQIKIYTTDTGIQKTITFLLTQSEIKINDKSQNLKQIKSLPLADVIGFNEEFLSKHVAKITMNSFPKRKKWFRSMKRYVQSQTFYIKTNQQGLNYEKFKENLIMAITNRPKQRLNKLRLMIYFNPNAGANSKKHLQATIKFLKFTNFDFDILTTQRPNHCLEHLNALQWKQYEGIVIISGDGLMHQFVNSQTSNYIPVTHVPGGSGNAFSKTQTMLAGQLCKDEQAIFLAIKGRTKKMNLIKFQLQKIPRPIYSFLSFEWCIMADIDVNSQFLRFLGGFRFQLYTVWRILFLRRYKGKFTYSTTKQQLPPLTDPIEDDESFIHEEDTYLHNLITSIPYVSDKYEFSPLLKVQDQSMDMQVITQKQGRWQLIKYLLNSQNGGHFDKALHRQKEGFQFNWAHIKSFRLEPNGEDFGVFGIDGQRYEAQKIQASVSDRKIITFI